MHGVKDDRLLYEFVDFLHGVSFMKNVYETSKLHSLYKPKSMQKGEVSVYCGQETLSSFHDDTL